MATDTDRKKALNLAIAQIEKQLGKGTIMRMGSDAPRVRVAAISTGAISVAVYPGGSLYGLQTLGIGNIKIHQEQMDLIGM